MNRSLQFVISVVLLCSLLLGWHLAALRLSDLVLPGPLLVLQTFIEGWSSGYFLPHTKRTMSEILLGLLIGGSVGFFIGVMMGESENIRKIVHPYIIMSQAVPKLALAPLFILWFGFGMTSKVVITALVCFFPILESTLQGMHRVPKDQQALFQTMQATRLEMFFYLKLPASIPYIMSGLRVSVILAVVGAVVGEFIGASEGLGALIIAAQGTMNTPMMFAVLINLTAIGLLLYSFIRLIERTVLKKYLKRGI